MSDAGRPRRRPRAGRIWLWPLLLIVLAVAIALLPWRDAVGPLRVWIASWGALGWVAYTLLYVVVVALPLPAAAMATVGGLIFGWWGLPLALCGSVLGALPPFLATRRFLREPVRRRYGGPRVTAVDGLVRRHAWLFVTLLRITPLLPFTVQNYILGLTSVRGWPYVGATALGLAPSTVALVWLGTLGGFDPETMAGRDLLLSVAGLAAFGVAMVWLTVAATRRLRHAGFDARR